MSALARTDTSVVGRWWWTVDRWSLAGIATLVLVGAVLTLAASPAVADRIGLDSFFFVKRHFALLPPASLLADRRAPNQSPGRQSDFEG